MEKRKCDPRIKKMEEASKHLQNTCTVLKDIAEITAKRASKNEADSSNEEFEKFMQMHDEMVKVNQKICDYLMKQFF